MDAYNFEVGRVYKVTYKTWRPEPFTDVLMVKELWPNAAAFVNSYTNISLGPEHIIKATRVTDLATQDPKPAQKKARQPAAVTYAGCTQRTIVAPACHT